MSDLSSKIYQFIYSSTNGMTSKIGILSLIFYPFVMVFDKLGSWLKIASIYASILTVISFIFGYSYICAYGNVNNIFCNSSSWWYWFYMLIKLVILAFFITEWIAICAGEKYFVRQSFKLSIPKIKTALIIIALMTLSSIGIISGYLLAIRIPSPDWKIELGYFTIVSLGFLVPILATRFYSLIAFAGKNKPLPSMRNIWKSTKGQTMKILFSLFVILIVMVSVLGNYLMSFRYDESENLWVFSIISEFILNILVLLFIAIWAGNCITQKEIIEMGNKND